MKDHGALDGNFGIKKIVSEDRHRKRKTAELEQGLKSFSEKIDKKQKNIQFQKDKINESKEEGQGKRLYQRENSLGKMEIELKGLTEKAKPTEDKMEALGPPKQRADRDFRKQKIIRNFVLGKFPCPFSFGFDGKFGYPNKAKYLLYLFFESRGAYLESFSDIVYWLDTDGLSKKNKLKPNVINLRNLSTPCHGSMGVPPPNCRRDARAPGDINRLFYYY